MSIFRSASVLISFLVTILAVCALEEVGAAERSRTWRSLGGQPLNRFTATLTVTQSADICMDLEDPTTIQTEVVTVSQEGSIQVSNSQFFFSGAPVYRKPGDGTMPWVDYDEAGNFLLWRTVESYQRSTPEGGETLKFSVLHRVSPEGFVITESAAHQQLEKRSAGLSGGASRTDLALLALGQGFNRYLKEAPILEKRADGLLHGRVEGKLGRSQEGTWELVYAPDGDWLVRKATFYGAGQLWPALSVVNEGMMTVGEITLARSGEIRLGRPGQQHRLKVNLKSLSPVADARLFAEVNERIERPLPEGAEKFDLRDGKFERVVVKPDLSPPMAIHPTALEGLVPWQNLKAYWSCSNPSRTFWCADVVLYNGTTYCNVAGWCHVSDPSQDRCYYTLCGTAPPNCCECGSVSKVFNECGHIRASSVCASDWCIRNEINTASCFQKAATGTTDCRIRLGTGPLVVQRLILLPNGGCPTAGNSVTYATKTTVYSSCSSCTPGNAINIKTACDVTSCPAGEEACSSNRGQRHTCY